MGGTKSSTSGGGGTKDGHIDHDTNKTVPRTDSGVELSKKLRQPKTKTSDPQHDADGSGDSSDHEGNRSDEERQPEDHSRNVRGGFDPRLHSGQQKQKHGEEDHDEPKDEDKNITSEPRHEQLADVLETLRKEADKDAFPRLKQLQQKQSSSPEFLKAVDRAIGDINAQIQEAILLRKADAPTQEAQRRGGILLKFENKEGKRRGGIQLNDQDAQKKIENAMVLLQESQMWNKIVQAGVVSVQVICVIGSVGLVAAGLTLSVMAMNEQPVKLGWAIGKVIIAAADKAGKAYEKYTITKEETLETGKQLMHLLKGQGINVEEGEITDEMVQQLAKFKKMGALVMESEEDGK